MSRLPPRVARLVIMLCLALLCLLFVVRAAGASGVQCPSGADAGSCLRVLFIGNSYTFVNDLPRVFGRLAEAGGHAVGTEMAAQGGWRLADHVASEDTRGKLTAARWNIVVIQEQSQIPAVAGLRQATMYPAGRQLVRMARESGASPMLFQTWAHRDGLPEAGLRGYQQMQAEIDAGYQALAAEQHVPVVPVGYAWKAVVDANRGAGLWAPDGSHPSVRGTYLAACVFYASTFRQSPVGLRYHDGVSADEARTLQASAAAAVRDG